MNLLIIPVVLLLVSLPASGRNFTLQAMPSVKARLLGCRAHVQAMAEQIYLPPDLSIWNLWRRPQVHVGTFGEVLALLEKNKVPEPVRLRIQDRMKKVRELLTGDGQMDYLYAWLARPENDLFVCMGNQSCRIRVSYALGAHVAGPANLVPLSSQQYRQLEAQIRAGVVTPSTQMVAFDKAGPTAIFMNTHEHVIDTDDWAEILFHELSHSADLQLLSMWANANQYRVSIGLEADPVFKAMFVVVNDKFYMHMGMYKLFMESRAYRISALVGVTLEPQNETRVLKHSATCAHNEVVPHFSQVEWDFLGLDDPNIMFEKGQLWGDMMDATIADTLNVVRSRLP